MASKPAGRPAEKLFHGVPIYGLRSGFRATVKADQKSMDMITAAIAVHELGLHPIDPSASTIQEVVDEAKCAAAEHLVDKEMFPSAALRDALRYGKEPYQLLPLDESSGLRSEYFDMGEWLSELRDYSACFEGKYVYDVAVLTQPEDPTQPLVFDLYKSQPTIKATHTLWYVRQVCWIAEVDQTVDMLQALVPQAAPTPGPTTLPALATPALLPAPVAGPSTRPNRVRQPANPHHNSAAPYAGWTADQIFAQVHTEHMFGGVILVLHLEYTKAELFKKINEKRQQVEGMAAFGPSSKQVVHYRIKAALQHIFGKDNYNANADLFKGAKEDSTRTAAWRTTLDAPATYNIAACDMGCSRTRAAAPAGGDHRQTDDAGPSSSSLQPTATDSDAAETADPLPHGSSQAQATPEQAQMSAEVVRQESPDHSAPATTPHYPPPSSPPILLDPALFDDSWMNATSSSRGHYQPDRLHTEPGNYPSSDSRSHPVTSDAAAPAQHNNHNTLENETPATPTEANEGLEANGEASQSEHAAAPGSGQVANEAQQHEQHTQAGNSNAAPAETFYCYDCGEVTEHHDLCIFEGSLARYIRAQDAAERQNRATDG
ncbi:hypothetical protein BST61_g1121 [Cercospora zeina]